jgi:uncharacterized phage-like protein YoqJ
MEKSITASFTGHRRIAEKDLPPLLSKLDETITNLVNQGITRYLNGGAVGFDALAALAVITARKRNPSVKLILALPCTNQDERWGKADKQIYKHLLESADEIIYVSDKPYFDGCMAARNLYLIENSGTCIAYMKRGRSGASQTVRMAREHNLTIINLAEN